MRREIPSQWSRPWLVMWALLAPTLLVAAVLMPFRLWALLVALAFGVPEAVGVWHKGDRLPPLTYIAAWFLPRWMVQTLVGFAAGAIGAVWLGFPRPLQLGALLGLVTWALDHFGVTYSGRHAWAYEGRTGSGATTLQVSNAPEAAGGGPPDLPDPAPGLPVVVIDLDGTLAESTWPSPTIGAPLKEGVDALVRWRARGCQIVIWTARPESHRGRIQRWLTEQGLADLVFDVQCDKPIGGLYVDDRAWRPPWSER